MESPYLHYEVVWGGRTYGNELGIGGKEPPGLRSKVLATGKSTGVKLYQLGTCSFGRKERKKEQKGRERFKVVKEGPGLLNIRML